MGWFVGDYEWRDAKKPCVLVVKISYGPTNTITYDRDRIYKPGFFEDFEDVDAFSWIAERRARVHAKDILKNGITADNVYYPPHRIQEVKFKWGEWVEVEEEVKVKKWEVQAK